MADRSHKIQTLTGVLEFLLGKSLARDHSQYVISAMEIGLQSELTPSLKGRRARAHSGRNSSTFVWGTGAWHTLQLKGSTPGDRFSSLFSGQLRCKPPTRAKGPRLPRSGAWIDEINDARGLSRVRVAEFNSSNIATWRVYDGVKHGSWLAGCKSSCHGSKRYALYLMLDRRRVAWRGGRLGVAGAGSFFAGRTCQT